MIHIVYTADESSAEIIYAHGIDDENSMLDLLIFSNTSGEINVLPNKNTDNFDSIQENFPDIVTDVVAEIHIAVLDFERCESNSDELTIFDNHGNGISLVTEKSFRKLIMLDDVQEALKGCKISVSVCEEKSGYVEDGEYICIESHSHSNFDIVK